MCVESVRTLQVHDKQYPLPLHELPRLSGFCNQLAFALHWNAPAGPTSGPVSDPVRPLVTKLLALLHERDARRQVRLLIHHTAHHTERVMRE